MYDVTYSDDGNLGDEVRRHVGVGELLKGNKDQWKRGIGKSFYKKRR